MITDYFVDDDDQSVVAKDMETLKDPYKSANHVVLNWRLLENDPNRGLKSESFAYNVYHRNKKNWVVDVNGKDYLKSIITKHSNNVMDKNILSGMPTIKGTRIPVSLIISCLNDDMSINDICEDYELTQSQVKASLTYVEDLLNNPFFEE
ncbi:DUF433 domain-containing protein [Lentibacillus sp. Marseille-P4043]|uniref:DUF433 domain-containing protein n=1 Tax=Lentibacillus sp. Marseille-P4043 TaxID=2040293 RepID=UPI000D0BD421|nr:DUF433 domain-containing protein [Lentibacillus sp. Marseille-P4043]